MFRTARFFAIGCACAWACASGPAAAYQEAHLTGDDVRITVDARGQAQIEHALAYRVASGTLKQFDLNGLEAGAILEADARITSDDGRDFEGRVEAHGERGLRVSMNEPKGLPRGNYVVRVRYAADFVQSRELAVDGAMWRLTWTAPAANEGYDAARVIFDFPASQTEPRAMGGDATATDDGHTATLRRTAQIDELEMARPRVARGEAAPWVVRVDPKAFPQVQDPELRPPPPPPVEPPSRWKQLGIAGAFALVALLFGLVIREKTRRIDAGCEARGVAARPLVRMGATLRASLAGCIFAAGAAGEAMGAPTLGALAILAAMALSTFRAPHARTPIRGPGQWLALTPAEAFRDDASSDALDAGTRAGKMAMAACVAFAVMLALVLRPIDAVLPYVVILDLLALVPIFFTGTRAQLPPDAAKAGVGALAAMHRSLRKDETVKIAPWGRVPAGADKADELRLLVLPKASMPGLTAIEIGLAWQRTANGYIPATEVLVRMHDATAAAARMTTLAPRVRALPGRKPDERVVRLVPALPGKPAALALVKRLSRELVDRRVTVAARPVRAYSGAERRIPPNVRLAESRAAEKHAAPAGGAASIAAA